MIKREPRTERLDVRLTRDDKAAIEGAAAKAGLTTSEYVRACSLGSMTTFQDVRAARAYFAAAGAGKRGRVAESHAVVPAQARRVYPAQAKKR